LKSSSPGVARTSSITGDKFGQAALRVDMEPPQPGSLDALVAACHDGPSTTGLWHVRLREGGIGGDYGGRGDANGLQVMHVHGHA
jgi:hypothetical protein